MVVHCAGTNAACLEQVANIPAMRGAALPDSGDDVIDASTVVNTEWGAYDSPLVPRCDADVAMDADSVRPGAQPFEKLVAGMYLGEIARRCGCPPLSLLPICFETV
jgi:hexokinase